MPTNLILIQFIQNAHKFLSWRDTSSESKPKLTFRVNFTKAVTKYTSSKLPIQSPRMTGSHQGSPYLQAVRMASWNDYWNEELDSTCPRMPGRQISRPQGLVRLAGKLVKFLKEFQIKLSQSKLWSTSKPMREREIFLSQSYDRESSYIRGLVFSQTSSPWGGQEMPSLRWACNTLEDLQDNFSWKLRWPNNIIYLDNI